VPGYSGDRGPDSFPGAPEQSLIEAMDRSSQSPHPVAGGGGGGEVALEFQGAADGQNPVAISNIKVQLVQPDRVGGPPRPGSLARLFLRDEGRDHRDPEFAASRQGSCETAGSPRRKGTRLR